MWYICISTFIYLSYVYFNKNHVLNGKQSLKSTFAIVFTVFIVQTLIFSFVNYRESSGIFYTLFMIIIWLLPKKMRSTYIFFYNFCMMFHGVLHSSHDTIWLKLRYYCLFKSSIHLWDQHFGIKMRINIFINSII